MTILQLDRSESVLAVVKQLIKVIATAHAISPNYFHLTTSYDFCINLSAEYKRILVIVVIETRSCQLGARDKNFIV